MAWYGLIFMALIGFALSLGTLLWAWSKSPATDRPSRYSNRVSILGGTALMATVVMFLFLVAGIGRATPLPQYMFFVLGICATIAILWAEGQQPADARNYPMGLKLASAWVVIGAVHLAVGIMVAMSGGTFGMSGMLFVDFFVVVTVAIFRSLIMAGQHEHDTAGH